ncbi:related to glyoxal oxidase precursor [Phialocephala subalpina]|uniref:Related to glyoxal oxidase n=1 Tax=Phialocephala subalpina TaxID=576137 RepID=A0A1L7XFR3_9HELO|nr:related to glyoxal oxidase precursor [Phialocephala subalpina]
MKTSTLLLGLAASTSANIMFTHVPLSCNQTGMQMYHGCLRGQWCTENGDCVPVQEIKYSMSFRSADPELDVRDGPEFSTDGTCGPAHSNTICDPNSKVNTAGAEIPQIIAELVVFLGAQVLTPIPAQLLAQMAGVEQASVMQNVIQQALTEAVALHMDHCLPSNGCQSGCTGAVVPTSPTSPRSDGRCGKNFGGATCAANGPYGGCCSGYGHVAEIGSGNGGTTTSQEPVIGTVSATMPPESTATAAVTTDGTCGAGNGNTVCGNWPNGNCCSMYGFCGNTAAHCGAGCQSGNCLSAPVIAAPGPSPAPLAPNGGRFIVVGQSGVPAMHAGLMPNGRVFFLDKLENYTQLKTSDGYYAMSSEYDPATNNVVPLAYSTNAFCSGGTFLADGRVISVGGNAPLTWLDPNIGDGFTAIRYLGRSSSDASLNGQSWSEPGNKLASARWYATAQTMPDGTIFVASGSLNGLNPTVLANNNPTYEILSPGAVTRGNNVPLDILVKNQPYYMYPFIHLLSDGTLFIFVSKASQVFNVGSNTIVKELPDLPGDYRTYPNTGGSVLLPLSSKNNWTPDIIICGGGAYQDTTSPTDPSCGRIQPLKANAAWEMDSMPEGRGMVEGTLLPDGTVLWLNGGNRGAQGFGLMGRPTMEALLYNPAKALGQRFTTLASSTIPRLYHSVALLLLDGTVMVAGSNPVEMPKLQTDAQDPYVTEFRVEQYIPPYLQGELANQRPTNIAIPNKTIQPNGGQFVVSFNVHPNAQGCTVVLYHGGFVTHSVHMGHRMLELDFAGWVAGGTTQTLSVTAPPNHHVAPPGPYVVYVVVDGVPGIGQFVQVA